MSARVRQHTSLASFTITAAAIAAIALLGPAGAYGQEVVRARFRADGQVIRPEGYRSWMFVGTPLTPNALNNGEAPFPEFHHVYVEPSAYAAYQRTGRFPEGTQIVKELISVISTNANQDGSTVQVSGRGYFQGEFIGLELTVKDTQRFPNEPGGWAYFSFGHHPEPYAATAAVLPTTECNACHQANAADDFVFTQFYPVLRAAKPARR